MLGSCACFDCFRRKRRHIAYRIPLVFFPQNIHSTFTIVIVLASHFSLMHFKCLTVLILNIIASQNSSFISLLRYLLLNTKTQYKGRTIYYSFITIIIDACGHSVRRRFRHLTLKAHVNPPRLLFVIQL